MILNVVYFGEAPCEVWEDMYFVVLDSVFHKFQLDYGGF
jgi:hypothetical protein